MSKSAIGTLVDRTSCLVHLVHLAVGHAAKAFVTAVIHVPQSLSEPQPGSRATGRLAFPITAEQAAPEPELANGLLTMNWPLACTRRWTGIDPAGQRRRRSGLAARGPLIKT